MFVTKARYNRDIEGTREDINRINDRYWELTMAHDRLLAYLKLTEVTVPEHAKILSLKED